MLILGIDTSCDDTSISILEGKNKVLSSIVSSQIDLHSKFGGIVPEIASRKHIEIIDAIFNEAIDRSGIEKNQLDVICVTQGPGLIGSVLIGLCFAKGLAISLKKPIIGINHVEAHTMSIFLERDVEFPFISLVVSGGHTCILLIDEPCSYKVIGSTRDDAAGEALDKIAKFLGLGYPGGPIIEKISETGETDYVMFPRPMADEDNLDFSFSGLKTAFINWVKKNTVSGHNIHHVLASFQQAIFDSLFIKLIKAAKTYKINKIVVAGGVAANSRLRSYFKEQSERSGIDIFFPAPANCTDNAAMIAVTGYFYYKKGLLSPMEMKGFSRIILKGTPKST
ncbi:MAG TPA: tRNA (adenosine(37)-N6)-threonylcarbamoyltransferase complex transferase subunit TsaD [Syntrophorhabdaceae bacterium]|nr:tRNA (adenosine(37)-N6)-threonylcarbamoyltransferase complex transferase subunit TsaD [Syntrophorhabdaceae bacterium]HPP07102.1 tRNA (adenosine(37)-N6)-threonylcarbamoyltransferase complex transferase subunit TsaD [Syntrophorhabdaceae bacterium]